jgi:predicted alpha/beta superfamily hydrolase
MINAEIFTIFLPYPDKGDRKVWVYVPSHNEGDRLPVVYMTDGQNLFDEFPSPYGSWGVTQAVENERIQSGKAAVIVGIDNGNLWRDNELTPNTIGEVIKPESMDNFTNAEGEIFDGFLMNTVIPYIEEHFPVEKGREHNAVCGSSSGGLQAFFTALEHSEKFAFAGVFSPAFLLYSEESLRNYIASKMTADSLPYLYIYSGAAGFEEKLFPSVEVVYDLLMELCYPFDKLNEVILFENDHNEKAWKEIFPDFLHTMLNL